MVAGPPPPPMHRQPRRSVQAPPRVAQPLTGSSRTSASPTAPSAFAVHEPLEDDPDQHYQYRLHRKGIVGRVTDWLTQEPSWLTSLLFHLVLIVVLGVLFVPLRIHETITFELGQLDGSEPTAFEEVSFSDPIDSPEVEMDEVVPETVLSEPEPTELVLADLAPQIPVVDTANLLMGGEGTNTAPAPAAPGGITGRVGRRANAVRLGASVESEAAVDRALIWLATHQNYDGSWDFDLRVGRCQGKCSHSGSGSKAKNGATAMGLLPFLGAGNTSRSGKYKKTVANALNYLIKQQRKDGSFLDPHGRMYSHGLAALALCEAAALQLRDRQGNPSQDRAAKLKLRRAAQKAIDFIVYSQHSGGGWRYVPKERGDTSVVGWQAMALQSGRLGKLRVRDRTMSGITKFLNSVGSGNYGETYGYLGRSARPGTSAIGLLCRMYLGWDRTHPGIANGAEYLSDIGPSSNNVYYNYYATQVMHHYQGEMWEQWNANLRDHLVQTQVQGGHESGSWYFQGDHGSNIGGRLYITAMATMILEVYYRHMQIYSDDAVTDNAPPVDEGIEI